MIENITGRIAEEIKGKDLIKYIEPREEVKKIEPSEKKDVDHSTEDPNKTPKNIHPYLGKNFDKKV